MPKIDSRHIQLMNPFMRKNIRDINKSNTNFKEKYMNSTTFNIKNFCFELFEKFFEINKARALGIGLRRLRLNIFKCINI